ncbi:MAG: TIGR04255 family protein [Nitrospirae bacterium]|nr:TIGR04255 family protein [Nitrospirota bacterium]
MGKKMKNAPVYFTVAQVQFNPVLQMEGYLPTIQERMRAAHFPDFKQETIQKIVLQFGSPSDGSQAPKPSFIPQARCVFGNINRTTEFVLEHNALALQTTDYDTSETFFKTLLDGLGTIHDVVRLDFTERVGLRYFDAVLPKPDESFSDYLAQEVLGLSHKLDGKLAHTYSETVTINASGQLVSRVIIQDGRVGLPQEIIPFAPQIHPRFTAQEGRHAIIDSDAFYAQREAFSLETIASRLVALHVEIEKSFRATVTQFALNSWE